MSSMSLRIGTSNNSYRLSDSASQMVITNNNLLANNSSAELRVSKMDRLWCNLNAVSPNQRVDLKILDSVVPLDVTL